MGMNLWPRKGHGRPLTRGVQSLIAGSMAVGIGALLALPSPLAASAASASPEPSAAPETVRHLTGGTPLYDVGIHNNVTEADAANAAVSGTSVAQFRSSVTVGGKVYPYTMVGKNPAAPTTNASTTVASPLIPVVLKIGGQTFDPTVVDSCDAGASALTRTQRSPIYNAQPVTMNGTAIGTNQITDAFQRANFWHYAKPGGVNPTYSVNLARVTLPKLTITVPNAVAGLGTTPCGNHSLGGVEINWLDNYLRTVAIPSLAAKGVNSSTFPIFLVHNVVEFIGTNGACCVLGYHGAYTAGLSPVQTYSLSMYDNTRDFAGSSDISVLTHEVGEWMDDPNVTNPTPKWGHIGQVTGCQANLEVGDPLTGHLFSDPLGGFTYHPQELAFFSWFYHQSVSLGANHLYSDHGTFRSYAAPCS
jgi:hypothetical protein